MRTLLTAILTITALMLLSSCGEEKSYDPTLDGDGDGAGLSSYPNMVLVYAIPRNTGVVAYDALIKSADDYYIQYIAENDLNWYTRHQNNAEIAKFMYDAGLDAITGGGGDGGNIDLLPNLIELYDLPLDYVETSLYGRKVISAQRHYKEYTETFDLNEYELHRIDAEYAKELHFKGQSDTLPNADGAPEEGPDNNELLLDGIDLPMSIAMLSTNI